VTRKEYFGQRLQYIITLIAVYVIATPIVYWLLGYIDFGTAISDWVEPRSVFLGLMVIYTIASFRNVGAEDNALILRFGRPIMQVSSGLVFVPLWVCTLWPEPKTVIQLELPGDPQFVWRLTDEHDRELPIGVGKNGEPIKPPPGGVWVNPIRITTASPETSLLKQRDFGPIKWDPKVSNHAERQARYDIAKSEFDAQEKKFVEDAKNLRKGKDPLNERLTIEPQIVVRMRIVNLVQFVQVIGNRTAATSQIEDTAIGVVQEEFARRTPALILAHIKEITARIQTAIEILIGEQPDPHTGDRHEPWGIAVSNAQLKLIGLTKTVNVAIAGATAAGFKAKEDATRGTGEGEEIKNRMAGETAGLEKRGEAFQNPGVQTAATLDAMVTATKNNSKFFVAGDTLTSNILSAVGAAAEVLTPPKLATPPAPPPGSTPPAP
jgi:regulator of protease activity HflC (stomatin/prohibitin superfamily)